MKITTASAVALAASGAAAQNTWTDWGSWAPTSASTKAPVTSKPGDVKPTGAPTKECPATLTVLKTKTETVYASTVEVYKETVTVPIPEKPTSVNIKPNWVEWTSPAAPATTSSASKGEWSQWTSASSTSSAPCYTLPPGCKAKTTVESTTTTTSTQPGTTTIYKSTCYVGVAGYTDYKPAAPKPTGGNYDNNKDDNKHHDGNNNNNGGNYGGDNNNYNHGGNGGNGLDLKPSGKPHQGGLWNDIINDVKEIGSNFDVFDWIPDVPTETKTGVAPVYTKRPDGGFGGSPWGEGGSWEDWPILGGGDDDDDDDDKDGHDGNGNHGGHHGGNGGNGGHHNGTQPGNGGTKTNGTGIEPGSPGSNVTKPYEPLKDGSCNSAGSRDKWCDGKSIASDYYEDYFTQKTCEYDLTITNGTANWDGTDRPAFLINGQFEGPVIECNWGDLVKITVHNQLASNGTAIHWHGIRQVGTNDQDGVPGVTECALAPGHSKTYTWVASSYGTSWYHSHWGVQYGDGIRGPIIIHGPATADYDIDAGPVLLSDTVPGTVAQQGWILAHRGARNTVNYLMNGHNVAYDLSAGQHSLWSVKKGKKYLFRIINGAVQNMFSVSIDDHKMKVIAADFVPIKPYVTDFLDIGIGQRYDVIVEMDQKVDSYFFRAITQTRCPSGCQNTGLGAANGIIAYEGVNTSPYYLPTTTVNGGKTIDDFATCNDEPLASLVPYVAKSAGDSGKFTKSVETITGGNVTAIQNSDGEQVFRWYLNGQGALYINMSNPTLQSLNEGVVLDNKFPNYIELKQKDEWVYFVIQNQFFAGHPMHLHGHDFSVLGQGQGLFTSAMVSTLNFDNPIRRDTVMLEGTKKGPGPYGYTVIGFETDNPGAWLMHCHIAWHIDGGLGLQWIERRDDMKSKYNDWQTQQFKDECSVYAAYEAENPDHCFGFGSSGLRKRGEDLFFDTEIARLNRRYSEAVRREGSAAAHYLDAHMKRGLGDGSARHFGRRR